MSSKRGRAFHAQTKQQPTSQVRKIQPAKSCCTQPTKVEQFSKEVVYFRELKRTQRYFFLSNEWFAVADCSPSGQLKQGYCLIQCISFTDGHNSCAVYLCTCKASFEHAVRLRSTCPSLSEDATEFWEREKSLYCIHSSTIDKLDCNEFPVTESNSAPDENQAVTPVAILSMTPLYAAVMSDDDDGDYGLISHQRTAYICHSCSSRHCSHIQAFTEWCTVNEFTIEHTQPSEAGRDPTSVSSNRIPYPLPKELQQVHMEYETGVRKYPESMVPLNAITVCPHGNPWDDRCPMTHQWVANKGVWIYKESTAFYSEKSTVYYRPAVGSCSCKLGYDGQTDLLFNLDNKRLFSYGLLFQYLHLMVEGRNPLISYQRTLQRTYSSLSASKAPTIHFLRRAWNSFSRLLDISPDESFICPVCGPQPDVVICDGTMLGFRKDLLPISDDVDATNEVPEHLIKGSSHGERVLVRSTKGRELLLKYSGFTRDRKRITRPKQLTTTEFRQLCQSLEEDGFNSLSALLKRLKRQTSKSLAPDEYRSFLAEVARCSPACGMIQISGDDQASAAILRVAQGTLNIFSSEHHQELLTVQRSAPVLAAFLAKCPKNELGAIPKDVCDVLSDIIGVVLAPFRQPQPPASAYPPPDATHSKFSYFPHLPQRHGPGSYKADKQRQAANDDKCRKHSYGHPTLTPGIFTLYCQHGVCYGFEVLRSCESPRHPFELFTTRFTSPPSVIVYDNACQLHIYALNREPQRFKRTLFVVDRFHWRGHVGCSSGYNLDMYITHKDLNSQVNEQANAGLQHIKSQLAYMTFDNFVFHLGLFLCLKNKDAQRKIDVSCLSI